MADRTLVYFVSDVHLGLDVNDPADREARFVSFLKSIPKDRAKSLYLLGDIWDFWYEYHDVVPKGYVRVFAALMDLMDAGVEVCFFQGNHDIWCFHYFEEMGIRILRQPYIQPSPSLHRVPFRQGVVQEEQGGEESGICIQGHR